MECYGTGTRQPHYGRTSKLMYKLNHGSITKRAAAASNESCSPGNNGLSSSKGTSLPSTCHIASNNTFYFQRPSAFIVAQTVLIFGEQQRTGSTSKTRVKFTCRGNSMVGHSVESTFWLCKSMADLPSSSLNSPTSSPSPIFGVHLGI